MTMLEEFVKERNEALFSLDRNKIEAYILREKMKILAVCVGAA